MTADTAERRKWRKKPVVIEAVQFNRPGDHPAVIPTEDSPTGFGIMTLEHTKVAHEVTPGDWIITGVKGEVYACKPDIFAATYEPADEARAALPARAPEGWALVPREPTQEMMSAAPASFSDSFKIIWPKVCRDIYRAMLSASPPPPEQKEEKLVQALLEATQQEFSMARRMRAAIVEARRRLAKGRALWNGPCHECDSILKEALSADCPVRHEHDEATAEPTASPAPGPAETNTDCRTEDGITVSPIDSIITVGRVLTGRSLDPAPVQEALKDLRADGDVRKLLAPGHAEPVVKAHVGYSSQNACWWVRIHGCYTEADAHKLRERILSALTPPRPAPAPVAGGEVVATWGLFDERLGRVLSRTFRRKEDALAEAEARQDTRAVGLYATPDAELEALRERCARAVLDIDGTMIGTSAMAARIRALPLREA